jgi:hypothetical protein
MVRRSWDQRLVGLFVPPITHCTLDWHPWALCRASYQRPVKVASAVLSALGKWAFVPE